jgi:long-chain acyl-CoA synthetase
VYELLRGEVARVNRSLLEDELLKSAQIRRFLILHKELDADDGELTRTRKVRRRFIGERYAPLVDALNAGAPRAHIASDVSFEDGRKGRIEADLPIRELAPATAATAIRQAAE